MIHLFVRSASVLLSVVVLAGCGDEATNPGGNNPPPGPVQTTSVDVIDNAFDPDDIQVAAGATVTWTWTGSNPHTVTFDDASIGNSATKTDGSFQKGFDSAGTFTYFCQVHGRAVMSGEVVVQ